MEYGDLYKFICSMGIGVIAAGVFLVRVAVALPEELKISADAIQRLTPAARLIAAVQQSRAIWLATYGPWLACGIVIVGVCTVLVGLSSWRTNQKVRDRKEVADAGMTEHQLEKMTREEVAASAQAKARAELDKASGELPQEANLLSVVQRQQKREDTIIASVTEGFKTTHAAHAHQRVRTATYDLVLVANDPHVDDLLLNLVWFRSAQDCIDSLYDIVRPIVVGRDLYEVVSRRKARAALVLGVEDEHGLDQLKTVLAQLRTTTLRSNAIGVHVSSAVTLLELTPDAFREMLVTTA